MIDLDSIRTATSTGKMEDSRASPDKDVEVKTWRPSSQTYIVLSTMCIITLAAALDATSLSVALPVRRLFLLLHDTNTILTFPLQIPRQFPRNSTARQ